MFGPAHPIVTSPFRTASIHFSTFSGSLLIFVVQPFSFVSIPSQEFDWAWLYVSSLVQAIQHDHVVLPNWQKLNYRTNDAYRPELRSCISMRS
ncbi:hypothetical protein AcV7_007314 [Taiwanofungus camphoratus]|nr:hypothetical protein AcV7_007314 [Antrodia cinnamomea]